MSGDDSEPYDTLDADLDLSGRWRAGLADEELRRVWYTDDFNDTAFVDIDVPSHWRGTTAFVSNDEPLLYRRRFATTASEPTSRAWLLLDGTCTQGDIWLDEAYLGNTDGAWVPHRFEVTDALASRTEHVLGVEVASPPLGDASSKRGLLGTWQDGPYVAPGWNPGGIWRPVRIRRTGPVAITSHRVLCTTANATVAVLTITCTLDAAAACEDEILTRAGSADASRRQPLASGENVVSWTIEIANPDLWWPYELGKQPLIDVTVDVALISTAADLSNPADNHDDGNCSDRFVTRCGLREVTLRDWVLAVNGERVYAKGVLVGPTAHELGTVPVAVITEAIRQAKGAGCNLVRVHAHLARDEFYDAADGAGMLVWQDLPLYRGQNRSVRRTAVRTAQAAVDRLGAHPSIVTWCGHDDPDHVAGGMGLATVGRRVLSHELPNMNRSILDRSVKRALMSADPSRPTIGSSGTWPHPPTFAGTDTHLDLGWSAGEADDLARLARAIPRAVRFVQITPSPSASAGSIAPAEVASDELRRWPPDELAALVGDSPIDLDLLADRLPPEAFDTSDDWQRATRNYQAELIRIQVETLRRLKYHPSGGFVIAHLADIRPVMSTALIDHEGTTKPAYDALRAACAPVLVTLSPWPHCAHPGDEMQCAIHVINDKRQSLHDARVTVRLHVATDADATTSDDRHAAGSVTSWEFGGDVDADAVALVGRISLTVPERATRIDASLRLICAELTATRTYTVPVHLH